MTSRFELQPAESELQSLAAKRWQDLGVRERQLEAEAFEAGAAIRNGEFTLANLEAIVRWKSERLVNYLIGNGSMRIRRALEVASNPGSSLQDAVGALLQLHGVDLPMASSILMAVFPERYIELNFEDLEALGHARQDIRFYEEYLTFCRKLAEKGIVQPQAGLPGPSPLRSLDRALSQWARNHERELTLVG